MRSLVDPVALGARVRAGTDDADPRAHRARALVAHGRQRRRLDDHGLPALGRRLHADLRPPRRHVRQAPAARDRTAGCSPPAPSSPRSGTGLEVVVIGRMLQGAGGGIFPLCFGIIRDEFPREKVASSIGLISATFGIGGGAGLILGGVITDHASYHYIFWLGAVTAVLAAIATELFIPESPVRTPGRVDVRGALVLGRRPGRAAAGDLARQRMGLGRARERSPVRVRHHRARRLDRAPAPHRGAARRHRDARPAVRADDQHRDAARRLRHVRLLHPDPAARRGPRVDGLRLRPRPRPAPGC